MSTPAGNVRTHVLAIAATLIIAACDGIEMSGEEYLERAIAHAEAGRISAALIEARNAAQREPGDAKIRHLLGDLHLRNEDGVAAELELERALELGGSGPALRLSLARTYMLQRKYRETLELASVGGDTGTPGEAAEFLVLQADARFGLGERERALRDYRRARDELVPGYAPARLGEARIAAATGSPGEAAAIATRLVDENPEYTDAWLFLGQLALSQQRHDQVVAAFEAALRSTPPRERGIGLAAYQARVGLVLSLVGLGRLDDADAHADALQTALPGHFMPFYMKGFIAYHRDDFNEANRLLQESHAANRDFAPTLLLLGAVHYGLGSYRQAEAHLQRYTILEPGDAAARKLLGAARMQIAQPAKAMEAFRGALELSPEDHDLLAMIGTAAVRMGDPVTGRDYLEKAVANGAGGAGARTELARAYLGEGDYVLAVSELERNRTNESASRESEILLVVALIRQNELGKAENLVRELIERDGEGPLSLTLLGEISLARDDEDQAVERFERAMEVAGGSFGPARLNLAAVAIRHGEFDAARRHYEAALGEPPSASQARMGLARLALRRGDEKEGVRWLEEARASAPEAVPPRILLGQFYLRGGEPEKARQVAVEALQTSPDDREALIVLAEAEIVLRRFPDAATTLARLARLEPADADIQYRLGQVNLELDRAEVARVALRKARELRADFTAATIALALLEQRTGAADAAFSLADELRRRQPGSPAGHVLRGDLHMQQGDYAAAERAYAAAFRMQPDAQLVLRRHQALARGGDREAARRPLLDWLDGHPDDDPVRLVLANDYQSGGDSGRARAEYERLLADDPGHAVALNNLAWLYHEAGDPRAREYAERAHQALPDNPAVADTLGWILVREDRELPRAVGLLRSAASAAPQSQEIRYHLAVALVKTGNRYEARQLLRVLVDSGQAFDGRADAETLYREITGESPRDGAGG